ncbi:MAG TPA: CHAT domain-containing tetratricopeptide repeat protein, partial [Acidobacteriota bacterium]|nr:CHAT domain-containing tetratricopeptide repeat protein [Acidobacteriota bacterium]
MQIREKSLGADHPDVARTLLNLASLQAATRRHKEAQALFLRGIRTTELIRESIFTLLSERQKLTFVHRQSPSIHTFVQHTSQFLSQDPLSIEGAFSSWLHWKGAVQEAQGRYLNALILSEDPVIREKWEELQSVRRQIARLWVAGPGRMNLEIYRRILSDHEKKRESLEAELSALSQPYALERRVGRADPARIAELLPENSLYLDYARVEFYDFLNDRPQQSHYVVFALAKGPSLHLIDLGQSEKIDSLIQDYRKHINEITNKGRLDRQQSRQMKKLAAQLNQHLIKPIDSLLVNRTHLLVSPDGLLHLMPLEALVQEDGQYLLQKFRISYLASGRDVVRWADPALPRNEAVVMADPDFELSPKPQEISAELRGGISGRFKEMSLARLPDSRKEGAEVAKFLQAWRKTNVKLYVGREAVEQVLMGVESPRVLHLATHGYFLEDAEQKNATSGDFWEEGIPEASWQDASIRSGIFLAGAARSLQQGHDEGLVSASKIEGMQL